MEPYIEAINQRGTTTMNELKRNDSRFNIYMQLISFFFFAMALTLPHYKTDTLSLMFAAAFLLLAGLTQLAVWISNYLGRKLNAIIEELKIANEIPPLDETEKE